MNIVASLCKKGIDCTLHNISLFADFGCSSKCDFVAANCMDGDKLGFTKIYYCDVNESSLALVIFLVLFVLIAFQILSSTAEAYLSPALTKISTSLNCSQTLAGITLVALGNGAPDVLTAAIAGGSNDSGDIDFAIGSLFGAGLFVTSITIARVITKSPKIIQLNRLMAFRDQIFYLGLTLLILIYGIIGYIYWYMALCILLFYVGYIFIVIRMEITASKQKKAENEEAVIQEYKRATELFEQNLHTSLDFFDCDDENVPGQDLQSNIDLTEKNDASTITKDNLIANFEENRKIQNESEIENDDNQKTNLIQNFLLKQEQNSSDDSSDTPKKLVRQNSRRKSIHDYIRPEHFNSIVLDNQESKSQDQTLQVIPQNAIQPEKQKKKKRKIRGPGLTKKLQNSYQKLKHNMKLKFGNAKVQWKEMDIIEKIAYIWKIPIDFIRDITVPPNEEDWNKWRAMVTVITFPIFMIYYNLVTPIPSNYIVIICTISVSIIIDIFVWKTTHFNQPPSYQWAFSLAALLSALSWIGIIANLIIEFLGFIQIITQTSKVYLGMTFLAYGNSSGDFFTNGALSEKGLGIMGMTACYAGQFFNLSLGFGIALLTGSLKQGGKMQFELFKIQQTSQQSRVYELIQLLLGCGIILGQFFNNLIMIVLSLFVKYKFDKNVGSWLAIYYTIIFLAMTGLGIASDATRRD